MVIGVGGIFQKLRKLGLLGGLVFFAGGAFAQSSSAKKPANYERDLAVYFEVLNFYKVNSQYKTQLLGSSNVNFPEVNEALVRKLATPVIRSRFKKYNIQFQQYRASIPKLERQLNQLQEEIKKMPISDTANRSLHEIKIDASKSKIAQSYKVLYVLSIEANEDLQSALSTLRPEDRVSVINKSGEVPQMPGIYGGSWVERQKIKEIDKLNLTPVDAEFYNSQLGKKLEKDLGGRAEFWSYDYNSDELYVKVAGELGKLKVREDSSGTRFIQTRVGASFIEPRGRDEKIDMYNADGKFLTGNPSSESLFGEFPESQEKFMRENQTPARTDPHEGHDH